MAPVHFQSHQCQYCDRLVIDFADENLVEDNFARWAMSRDKIVFDFSFRDLVSASASGCKLCSWILDGPAISRQHIQQGTDLIDGGRTVDHSMYEFLARHGDDDDDCRRASLSEAVRDGGEEEEFLILVAATNPPVIRISGERDPGQDLLCIHYFGLLDSRTKLVPYRTAKSLQLFTCEGDRAAAYLSTRPIENQPFDSLSKISGWLEECKQNHSKCQVGAQDYSFKRVRPKRLINIGNSGESSDSGAVLRLQDTDEMVELPPFAALSYCWGGEQTVRCDETTVDKFKRSIPFEILPATVQDAITVCEYLGVQHLWVDAFCILQDNHTDKTIEIAKMPYVYGGAVFTIVASRAQSAWDGFLQARIPSPEDIPAFRLPWRCADGHRGTVTLVELDVQPEPIDERGWTFQERFLSSRVLDFGSRQTRYTCRENLLAQDLSTTFIDGWRKEDESSLSYTSETIWEMAQTDALLGWGHVILRYTERRLTHDTDRPLAISGMAERFSKLAGDDEYCAGLWKRSLKAGLLWVVLARDRQPRPSSYQGPSWSWLAVSSPVCHLELQKGEWGPERFDAEVCSVEVRPANPSAPYGATVEGSGRLRTQGRLARATYNRGEPSKGDPSSDHEIKIIGKDCIVTADLYLDYAEDAANHDLQEVGREVTVLEIESRSVGPSWFSFGLVLVPAQTMMGDESRKKTYVRIGVFEFATSLGELRERSATDAAGWGERTEEELNCFRGIDLDVVEII